MKTFFKIISLILIMCTVINMMSLINVSAEVSEYIGIYSVEDLKNINENLNSNYVLWCNLSLPSNWEPIGTPDKPFKGTFNGNGYTISNLTIDEITDKSYYGGLFGYTEAEITNLRMTSVNIKVCSSGSAYVGAIAGRCGRISDCYVSGSISVTVDSEGDCSVGGFVGYCLGYSGSNNPVRNCDNDVTVNVKSSYLYSVGSFFGTVSNTIYLYNSLSNGVVNVKATNGGCVGGMIGYSDGVVLKECVNNVNVSCVSETGTVRAGGFVGASNGLCDCTDVFRCANLGVVSVECEKSCDKVYVGGIIGQSNHYLGDTIFKETYNMRTLSVKGDGKTFSYVGGLAADVYSQGYYYIGAEDCFNVGTLVVENSDYAVVSGIITQMDSNWEKYIRNTYSAGKFIIQNCVNNSCKYIADFLGTDEVKKNYYLEGIWTPGLYDHGTELSKEEFTKKSSFVGFDFEEIWTMKSSGKYSYPVLRYTYSKNLRITNWETDLKNKDKPNSTIDGYGILENYNSMPNEVIVPVYAYNEKNGEDEKIKGAEVELYLGDTLIMSKTTDDDGLAVFTKKELIDSGWDATNVYTYGTLIASKKIKNDMYMVSEYYQQIYSDYYQHSYKLSSFDSTENSGIVLRYGQFRPSISAAFMTTPGQSEETVRSTLEAYVNCFKQLTNGRVVVNITSVKEYINAINFELSPADIKIYPYFDSDTATSANPNGYGNIFGHIYTAFESDRDLGFEPITMCHESMHYFFGVKDEYCCGYKEVNNSYHIDWNNDGEISDDKYLMWTLNKEHIHPKCKIVKPISFIENLNSIKGNNYIDSINQAFSESIYNSYDFNDGYLFTWSLQNSDICKFYFEEDHISGCLTLPNGHSEINGVYWKNFGGTPADFGIMGIISTNKSMHMSTSETYKYLNKYSNTAKDSVDKNNPQWYTAQYYAHGVSVAEHFERFMEGKIPDNYSYEVCCAASEIPDTDYVGTEKINPVYEFVSVELADDANSKILNSALFSSELIGSLLFSETDDLTQLTYSSDFFGNSFILVKYKESNILERFDVTDNDDISQIQIPKENGTIESVYVLAQNEDGSYSYNEYIHESFSEELSDGTHISSMMTVSTENDNTDVLAIFSEENIYTNGEYFSVGKVFNVLDNSSDETVITDTFVQTLSYSDKFNLSSVTAFLFDGENYTEIETYVGEGEDTCAYISFPYSGEGKYVLMAKAPADTVYEAPTNLLIHAEGSTYEKEINISFEDSNNQLDIAAYKLYYSKSEITDTTAEGVMAQTLKPGNDSYTLYLSDDYGDYYFYVEAIGMDGGKSPLSEPEFFSLAPYDDDGDGIPDYWLNRYPALKELEDIPETDSDDDGLTNLEEYQNDTNPLNPDTDGDNVNDSVEIRRSLNPLEPMTDGVTDDYIIAYGTPDLSIDEKSFIVDGSQVTCTIENKSEGKSPTTIIYLYIGDELIEASKADISSHGSVEYTFSREYLVEGMRIVIDEPHISRDVDYSNNEFVYIPATDVIVAYSELSVVKNTVRQLKYTLVPENASDILVWTSSDSNIASVDYRGVLTANRIGEVFINVTAPGTGKSSSCSILVESFNGAGKTNFDCQFINNTEKLEIIGYYGNDTDIIIPDSIGGYPVVMLNTSVFDDFMIESIVLGKNLSAISVLPSSSTALGGQSNLKTIEVAEGNTSFVAEDGVLYNADKTTLIKYPSKKEGTEFTIPETVTQIRAYAFEEVFDLEVVNAPKTLHTIGNHAFKNTNLKSFNYDGSAYRWSLNVVNNSNSDLSLSIVNFTKVTAAFIADGVELSSEDYKPGEKIVVPENVPEVEYCTFMGWSPEIPEVMPESDMSFYAVYEPIVYTATITDGDKVIGTDEFTMFDSELDLPDMEHKPYYRWVLDDYELIPEDIVVTGHYEPVQYTVTFVVDNVVVSEQYDSEENSEIIFPEIPEREGYTATWIPAVYEPGKSSQVIRAAYTPIQYTATFVVDGVIKGTDKFSISDTSLDFPVMPYKEYYTLVWDSYEIKPEDITVNGRYVPNTYTITFVSNGVVVKTQEYTIETVDEIVAPPLSLPEKENHISKWEDWEGKIGNITVNEVYVANTYKLSFYCNDVLVQRIGYTDSTKLHQISLPKTPVMYGYKVEWPEFTLEYRDQRIDAVYTPIEYTAWFLIDGEVVSEQKFTVETEKLVEPNLPQKAGYIAEWSYYEIKANDLIINARYYSPEAAAISKQTLVVGESFLLIPTCNFDTTNKTWVSSDTSVATVSSNGKVTAVGEGKCEITITCYGKDSLGNDIQTVKTTKIVVKEKSESEELKLNFRELFNNFFEVKLHEFLYNFKEFFRAFLPYLT